MKKKVLSTVLSFISATGCLFGSVSPVFAADNNVLIHMDGNGNDNKDYHMSDISVGDEGVYLRDTLCFYEKEGYMLWSWNTEPDGSGTPYKVWYNNTDALYKPSDFGSDEVTLYAQWVPSEGILKFNSNSGQGEMDDVWIKSGDEFILPESGFTKEGYDLVGWEVNGKDYKPGDKLTEFDTELDCEVTKSFISKADISNLSSGSYYAQGSTIFYKNGKRYFASHLITQSTAIDKVTGKHYDGHWISVFDWETGEEVYGFDPGHIGHGDDMYYDPDTGHIFIEVMAGCADKPYQWIWSENGVSRTYSLIEYDNDFNFIRQIPMREGDGIPYRYVVIDKQGDYWYATRNGYLHVWDLDFNYITKYPYMYPGTDMDHLNPKAHSLGSQGGTTDPKWLWGCGFSGPYYHNFVCCSALDGSGEYHMFKYDMGDKSVNANRRELEDMSYDPVTGELFAISTKSRQVTVEKVEANGIPTTEIKAVWEKSKCTVTFKDGDKIIAKQIVEYGDDAMYPDAPEREGYEFTGWDKDVKSIKSDIEINAVYREIHKQGEEDIINDKDKDKDDDEGRERDSQTEDIAKNNKQNTEPTTTEESTTESQATGEEPTVSEEPITGEKETTVSEKSDDNTTKTDDKVIVADNKQNSTSNTEGVTKSVNTGDSNLMPVWFILAGVSVAAMITGVVVYKRKKN